MNAPGSPSSALQTTYFFSPDRLRNRAPLQARGIAGAAATAQAATGDFGDHLRRSHLAQHLHERGVAADRDVVLNALGIDVAAIFEDNFLLLLKERNIGRTHEAVERRFVEAVDERGRVFGGNALVERVIADRNQRSGRAQTHAADAFDLAFGLLRARLGHCHRCRRGTSFSSAVFTPSLWQLTHPAATHTLTVCLNFAWRSRSVRRFVRVLQETCDFQLARRCRNACGVTLPATSWS